MAGAVRRHEAHTDTCSLLMYFTINGGVTQVSPYVSLVLEISFEFKLTNGFCFLYWAKRGTFSIDQKILALMLCYVVLS